MKPRQLIPWLLLSTLLFCNQALATASYSASSTGTLTLLGLSGPLSVVFFGADPAHSNTAFDGIQLFGNGGSSAGTEITDSTTPAPPAVGSSTTQTASASGSQTLPGFLTTDVLTTVLLDVINTSIDTPGSFTVRWDWSLTAATGIGDPLTETAVATAGAFLEDVTAGSTLIFKTLTVFDGDSGSMAYDPGSPDIFTLIVPPGGRNIIITGVDANGSATVVSTPAALLLLLGGLPLLWRRS